MARGAMTLVPARRTGHTSALVGGTVWVMMAALSVGRWYEATLIELLFLLAPLVVVPLALELVQEQRECFWLVRLQPVFAAMAVVAVMTEPGSVVSVGFAAGWLAFCVMTAVVGWRMMGEARTFVAGSGMSYLLVGGGALVAARLDVPVIGYTDPLIFLAAVHFHYAGFALQIVTAEVWRHLRGGRRLLDVATVGIVLLPGMVLAGFVLHSVWFRSVAAIGLALAVTLLAVVQLARLRDVRERAARVLVGGASVAVIVAMGLAAAFAVADWAGTVWISIPTMARTHGVLNAAFVVAMLVGWRVERAVANQQEGIPSCGEGRGDGR